MKNLNENLHPTSQAEFDFDSNLAPIQPNNLLPYDGCVEYLGKILTPKCADEYFNQLFEDICWQHDQAMIFGRCIQTKRKVAWYGNQQYSYTYSGIEKKAMLWTPVLLGLKAIVEAQCAEQFNSCLLNLYHDGSEGMAWHSDGEKDLKPQGTIASLSLGASRRFLFKHKVSHEKIEIQLMHGSLLLMKGCTQSHWLHHLPTTKRNLDARINLTFRNIVKNVPSQFK